MTLAPIGMSGGPTDGPEGYSYGAVLLAAPASGFDLATLRGIRFSGWIAPPRDGWIVVLGDPRVGVIASERRGILDVGALLAGSGGALAVQVRRDRQLSIAGWSDGVEIGRYCSDPSREPGADPDVYDKPVGAEAAEAFADLAGRPETAEKLFEILDEALDPDSVSESERLRDVLRLLGMPEWIVAAGALPHGIPSGPPVSELTRLRAGAPNAQGLLRDFFVRRFRKGHVPPPAIADPPRGGGDGFEPWMA